MEGFCKNGYSETLHYLKVMGVNIGVEGLYKYMERDHRKWKHELPCDVVIENDGSLEVSGITPGLLSNENNPDKNDDCIKPPKN